MKRLAALSVLGLLFSSAWVVGKSPVTAPTYPDSLRSVYHYTEGIKQLSISGDTLSAQNSFREAIRYDSAYAPAYFALVSNALTKSSDETVEFAHKAYQLDTTNRWYHRLYAQSLLHVYRYAEALTTYNRLLIEEPQDPDNYRILAALYDQQKNPYMALTTLDSAEMRFGRIPLLSTMKRRLLVLTHQTDKAIDEARTLVEEIPYEAEHRVALGELYGLTGKDSLALVEYNAALHIDSTNLQALMSLADFYNERRNYDAFLVVSKRLFLSDALPLEGKVRRFEQLTSDVRFYREYYSHINDLAMTLAIHYPKHKEAVLLYGTHLMRSREVDQALALYKLHLEDQPPVEEYFNWVIHIEGSLNHPDSMQHYITRALTLFPENFNFLLSRGNAFLVANQYNKAVDAYKVALRRADSDSLKSLVWGEIGNIWHQKAEMGGAAAKKAKKACYDAYKQSLRYNKDNSLVLNNYAYFLAVDGQELERALEMSSRVIALPDNNSIYLDTHAWVLFRLGRLTEAKKVLQQAVALDGQNSPELLAHYGDVLHALGEQFMAESYWRRAQEKGFDAAEIERRMQQQPLKSE